MNELPEAFRNRMSLQLGSEFHAFRSALEEAPPTAIRINPLKNKPDTPGGKAVPWCDSGVYLAERPKFRLDPLWHAGAYYVQDASSMFLEVVAIPAAAGPTIICFCRLPRNNE